MDNQQSGTSQTSSGQQDHHDEPTPSSSASAPSTSNSSKPSKSNDDESKESNFDCNICLDPAKDAVVSVCGHLFCWECLHEWFHTRNPDDPFARSVPCPVCKNPIQKDKVIPLYGRGGENKDPRERNIPPRPQGQRSSEREAFNQPFFHAPADGFHMSFGIGAFPFGLFATTFNIAGGAEIRGLNLNFLNGQQMPEEIISKIFLFIAVISILWLLFS